MSDAPRDRGDRVLCAACILAILGLGISVVHLVFPSPLLFALFMTAGQGSVAGAIGLFGYSILRDLRSRKVL